MSRGSRGGFGRGRGSGGMGIGVGGAPLGAEDLKPDYSVTELFPPQPQPVQSSLTKEERAIVTRYCNHRERIHNGPMYTVMARKRGMEDPFNDVGKYSSKYTRQPRRAPMLDARPYIYEFFPTELYPTIGKDVTSGTKKRLLFSALDTLSPLDDLENAEDAEDDGEGKEGKKSEQIEDIDHEADDGGSEAELDDFADDEEGDYNAEQYFEDGDDIGDDYGDDDGAGDYY